VIGAHSLHRTGSSISWIYSEKCKTDSWPRRWTSRALHIDCKALQIWKDDFSICY
jgi:hypothetical protein